MDESAGEGKAGMREDEGRKGAETFLEKEDRDEKGEKARGR